MNKILEGIVGSTAYGLAHSDSDEDRLGVFLRPNHEMLSLNPGKESIVTNDPDVTYHELNKFVKLCVANNPTVMELLWLDDYTIKTVLGSLLVVYRQDFLSQRIRKTYGGYANQQKERLLRRGDFGADLKKRQEKHGRHCCRLIIQGKHALETGELRVRLTEDEAVLCRYAGKLAATDQEEFGKLFDKMIADFDATPSDLPESMDIELANSLIRVIRGV